MATTLSNGTIYTLHYSAVTIMHKISLQSTTIQVESRPKCSIFLRQWNYSIVIKDKLCKTLQINLFLCCCTFNKESTSIINSITCYLPFRYLYEFLYGWLISALGRAEGLAGEGAKRGDSKRSGVKKQKKRTRPYAREGLMCQILQNMCGGYYKVSVMK